MGNNWMHTLVFWAMTGCICCGSDAKIDQLKRIDDIGSTIVYIERDGIYKHKPGATISHLICPSKDKSDVEISPNGNVLAFTLRLPKDGSKFNSTSRRIAIFENGSDTPKIFNEVKSNNSYGPKWSPKSDKIVFNCLINNKWSVAIVNRDGSGFKVLAEPFAEDAFLYAGAWSNDANSFYVYNSVNVYQIGLDGSVICKIPFKKWSITLGSIGGRMALSPDGKKFLLEAEIGSNKTTDSLDTRSVVYVCSIDSDQKTIVNSKYGHISKACWSPNGDSIIFSASNKKQCGIYSIRLADGHESLLLPNASGPSISMFESK